MKTLIKSLLGVWLFSLVCVGILYLLSLWDIVPIPLIMAWKVVATIAGVIVVVLLCWLCSNLFFRKGNRGDVSQGNKAHPMN